MLLSRFLTVKHPTISAWKIFLLAIVISCYPPSAPTVELLSPENRQDPTVVDQAQTSSIKKHQIDYYLETRQYREAMQELMLMLADSPDSSFALSRIGTIYFADENDPEMGSVYFDEAIRNESDRDRKKQYFFDRGNQYRLLGMYTQAINDYREALSIDKRFREAADALTATKTLIDKNDSTSPSYPIENSFQQRTHKLIADYLEPQPEPEKRHSTAEPKGANLSQKSHAVLSVKKDIQQARDDLQKGAQLFYRGQLHQAAMMFLRVLSSDQDQEKAYFMLGKISETKENGAMLALPFYQKAYNLMPAIEEYRLALARCLYHSGNATKALDRLNKPFRKELAPEALNLKEQCLKDLRREEETISSLAAAPQIGIDLPTHSLDQSFIIQKINEKTHLPALTGERPPAEILKEPVGEVCNSPPPDIDTIIESAQYAFINGQTKRAKKLFFKAVELAPDMSEPFFLIGTMFLKEQRFKKAILYFNQAIDRDNDKTAYFLGRGKALYAQEDYQAAERDFTSALLRAPASAELRFLRGTSLLRLGERSAALSDYARIETIDDHWKAKIREQLTRFR